MCWLSFFFAYALGQLPAGWLADRFGPRRMLVAYIVALVHLHGVHRFYDGARRAGDRALRLRPGGSRRLSRERDA